MSQSSTYWFITYAALVAVVAVSISVISQVLYGVSLFLLSILVMWTARRYWPAFFEIAPRHNFGDESLDKTRLESGLLEKMSFAIENASSGSKFSRNEIAEILKQRLLSQIQSSETSRMMKTSTEIESMIMRTVPEDLIEVFAPSLVPSTKKSLKSRIFSRQHSSKIYLGKLERAISLILKEEL